MPENTSFETIQKQYFFLEDNYDKLLDACETQGERDQFRRDHANARDNFWEARNRVFMPNDPMVKSLTAELKLAQEKIEEMTGNLKDIVKTLNAITAGVRLASSLIVLGSGVV